MSVFIDTSAFYAVLDANDAKHDDADSVWTRLLTDGETLFTSNYILVETHALLQHRIGLDAVQAFVSDLLPILHLLWVDESVHATAIHAFLTARRRQLSLADCVSFEMMRRNGIERAFCFDNHFSEQGFLDA